MPRIVTIVLVEESLLPTGMQTSRLWQPLDTKLHSRPFSKIPCNNLARLLQAADFVRGEGIRLASDTMDGVVTMIHNHQHALQPPHPKTVETLASELQERIERDQQFIVHGEELLARWKATTHRIRERLCAVLTRQRGWD